jgi:uncharacterized RmlC-like cupin family protein
MNPSAQRDSHFPSLWRAQMADSATLNRAIYDAFEAVKSDPRVRRTHGFHGRFENTYVTADMIPPLGPLLDWVQRQAQQVLGRQDLRFGFWFNEMAPGDCTSLHSHEEDDELLSAVYYIAAAPGSGRLVLWDGDRDRRIEPEPGLLLMFPPDLPHEVETNRSGQTRLSVAFNFGPPADV